MKCKPTRGDATKINWQVVESRKLCLKLISSFSEKSAQQEATNLIHRVLKSLSVFWYLVHLSVHPSICPSIHLSIRSSNLAPSVVLSNFSLIQFVTYEITGERTVGLQHNYCVTTVAILATSPTTALPPPPPKWWPLSMNTIWHKQNDRTLAITKKGISIYDADEDHDKANMTMTTMTRTTTMMTTTMTKILPHWGASGDTALIDRVLVFSSAFPLFRSSTRPLTLSSSRLIVNLAHSFPWFGLFPYPVFLARSTVGWTCMKSMRKSRFPMSLEASEGTSEWAQRSARAVRSKRMSEWCEKTSERMSEWSITLRVNFMSFLPIVRRLFSNSGGDGS